MPKKKALPRTKKQARKTTASKPEPVIESLAIAVPPQRAWEALTSPAVLGQITLGHVEMDPRPGRAFLWRWDVWAQAAPEKGTHAWEGTVLDAVPGSTLVLHGGSSTATLTVKGEGEASLVTVVHITTSPRAVEDYRLGWADFLLRLKTLLERPANADSIYLRMLVRGKPDDILRAWLTPAVMSRLLPGKAKIEPRAGGHFEWAWKQPEGIKDAGVFIEIVKGHRVAFSWTGTLKPSEVRLAAEQTPYGAMVSLEHLGISPHATHGPPGRGRQSYGRMWAHLLERLRCYFYFGKKIRAD
jgi:uncharacterized protein YndB with AHSA1/START domain